MPTWVSKDGKFYPANEKVALVNHSNETIKNPSADWSENHGKDVAPGDPFIYEGPDRAALFYLYETKQESLGQDFHQDADLIARVRQLDFKSINAYARAMGWDKIKVDEEFKKKASKIIKHGLPETVAAINRLGGGRDMAGQGQDRYGGFGEIPKT